MEQYLLLVISILLLLITLLLNITTRYKSIQQKSLPPCPPSQLPIIGHLHLIDPSKPLHRTLQTLAEKIGPIFYLRLGFRDVVVVSTPQLAEEILNKNDTIFANRPKLTIMGEYLGYYHTTLISSPYGDHWRNLRRICDLDIFSSNRLNVFLRSRREQIVSLIKAIDAITKKGNKSIDGFSQLELRPLLSKLTFNIIIQMICGEQKHSGGGIQANGKQYREIINEVFEESAVSYPGDFLPFLKWIDFKGYLKKVRRISERVDSFLQGLVDQQRSIGDKSGEQESMISHLLSLQESQPEYYTDQIIKGLCLNMSFAGTDTSSLTIEWAMANLMKHPEVMEKLKNEIDVKVGQGRLIEESDLPKLQYLQNVLSETLRLYPSTPLLLPHCPSTNCEIGGYNVKKDTMVLVNAWAIHRNPKAWGESVLKFMPERFENGGRNEEEGRNRYMPFGLGRRSCPGMGLAHRVMGLTLGGMVQCFDWKRLELEEVDMSESAGISLPKARPLVIACKARDIVDKVVLNAESSTC